MKDSSQEQKHRHSDTQVKFMSSQPMDKKASLVTPQFENGHSRAPGSNKAQWKRGWKNCHPNLGLILRAKGPIRKTHGTTGVRKERKFSDWWEGRVTVKIFSQWKIGTGFLLHFQVSERIGNVVWRRRLWRFHSSLQFTGTTRPNIWN